jgi:hypothetical protein
MKQAFSFIFNFFNIASPCGDMVKMRLPLRFFRFGLMLETEKN